MTECWHIFTEMRKLQTLGLVYFCYLFLFSGLEFTLSFLTHQRFHFTRYEVIDKVLLSGIPNITAFWYFSLQYATRKDVFLHWRHHGFDSGRIFTQDQAWEPRQGCPDGKPLLFVPQKPHKYTTADRHTFFNELCLFDFRQSWHWSQHLSSSVCPGIQQPCIWACSCIHLVRFSFYSIRKQNWLNQVTEDTAVFYRWSHLANKQNCVFFCSCCYSSPMPLHTCIWTWWIPLTFVCFKFWIHKSFV